MTTDTSSIWMIIILVGMFAFFYFFVIRPQKKQQKEAQEKINALKVGDKVVTIGGFYAKIKKVLEDGFLIELTEGCVVKIARQGIAYPVDNPPANAPKAVEEAEAPENQSPIEE